MNIFVFSAKQIPIHISKGSQIRILKPTTAIFCRSINTSSLLTTNNLQSNKQFFQHVQIANFSKYTSKSRTKRLPLNTKRVGKGYKKGYGARREGMITRKGKFIQNKDMLTELVVPDLKDFKLKPYVGAGAKRNVVDKIVPKL